MRLTLLLVLVATALVAAKKVPVMEWGKVLSQDIGSSQVGAYAAPIGNASIMVPINRHSNSVVLETERYILELEEIGRNLIVLPVNERIPFYEEGDVLVILDSKNKKHKFGIVGMRAKQPSKPPAAKPVLIIPSDAPEK